MHSKIGISSQSRSIDHFRTNANQSNRSVCVQRVQQVQHRSRLPHTRTSTRKTTERRLASVRLRSVRRKLQKPFWTWHCTCFASSSLLPFGYMLYMVTNIFLLQETQSHDTNSCKCYYVVTQFCMVVPPCSYLPCCIDAARTSHFPNKCWIITELIIPGECSNTRLCTNSGHLKCQGRSGSRVPSNLYNFASCMVKI